MNYYNFFGNAVESKLILHDRPWAGSALLPDNHIILGKTPFSGWPSWETFVIACHELAKQISPPAWVFVDATWDPVMATNHTLTQYINELKDIFPQSKVCMLSASAQHFYDDLSGCVYFPYFLMHTQYGSLNHQPKAGRIGCLNRRSSPHRSWLMYHLLDKNLVNPQQDVYSVNFANTLGTDSYRNVDAYHDVDTILRINWFNQAQRKFLPSTQTHPDGFPNDYSIDHPAWHTGIVIITETEPLPCVIITEKTAKGILSKSCFSIYMGEVGYRVLEDLGFEPRFFPEHAEDFNIDPIIDICQTITTEQQALEYRNLHLDKINHNFEWFAYAKGELHQRPWWAKYQSKLHAAFDML
jgi:hypothetical protein